MAEFEAEGVDDNLGQIAECFTAFCLDFSVDRWLALESDPKDVGASLGHGLLRSSVEIAWAVQRSIYEGANTAL